MTTRNQVAEMSRKVAHLEEVKRRLLRQNILLKRKLTQIRRLTNEHIVQSQMLQQEVMSYVTTKVSSNQTTEDTSSTYNFNELPASTFTPTVSYKPKHARRLPTLTEEDSD
ncbi:uncharacterized protein LOC129789160 [Lutzomyia longipalpis]|uniref:uncharacterized protein LOC129789160 n=1 Tax=Lutzomyia longipalpis TaxID=7200 RepID=UPI002484202C|nr:uncharacterized protein LOC129789160 [Lutzomyia longipalpis]